KEDALRSCRSPMSGACQAQARRTAHPHARPELRHLRRLATPAGTLLDERHRRLEARPGIEAHVTAELEEDESRCQRIIPPSAAGLLCAGKPRHTPVRRR